MSVCAVIPVYDHGAAVGAVVSAVRSRGLPCLLVDDGSGVACASVLDSLAHSDPSGTFLVRLRSNQGKGAATMAGLLAAHERGFTHALQIDADGQHDPGDIPRFIEKMEQHPEAIICGVPIFDASVPRGRLYARYLTHAWVWINTLSFAIRDSMCGFRIYPLGPTTDLITGVELGRRMDFDVEVLVRMLWRGVRIVNQPTRVRYPSDGISHFKLLRDNLLISRMHARLFFGMLVRAPLLLWHRVAA